MHLIFANMFTWLADGGNLLTVLKVVVGVGSLIFVHELGHFLVAKLCGVKCEKFYLGFDIAGLKLFKFQWGETEYGVGILPLGGYVKMLGQDDNPANMAEEAERAKAKSEDGTVTGLDPRSYMAQSVPERMAIISAGVIMNVLFAVVLAAWAYSLGVKELPAGISMAVPGRPAWKAGLRPGDQILQIGADRGVDDADLTYEDLIGEVIGSSAGEPVPLKIKRVGEDKPIWINVYPDVVKSAGRPQIGVVPQRENKLVDELPARTGSVAAKTGKFKGDDVIAQINDVPTPHYANVVAELTRHVDDEVTVKVTRGKETVDIALPKTPLKRLGLVMKMGQITGVEDDSPAGKAGLKPGDLLTQIDGQVIAETPGIMNPLTLGDVLRRRAQQGTKSVKLTVQRTPDKGPSQSEEIEVPLRVATWPEYAVDAGLPASVPALGITYRVMNRVQAIEPGSPLDKLAEDERLRENDEILERTYVPSEDAKDDDGKPVSKKPLKLGEDAQNYPHLAWGLQYLPAGTKVQLAVKRGDKKWTVTVEPDASPDFNWPDRGFVFDIVHRERQATDIGDAFKQGWRQTKRTVRTTVNFVKSLFTGRVSLDNTGGFGSIAAMAGQSAEAGFATLLLFLVALSVNLAVLNSLPIPVLDGGHMMFLLYELIRRKPPSIRVQNILTLIGFAFILFLVIYTNGLDLTRLIDLIRGG